MGLEGDTNNSGMRTAMGTAGSDFGLCSPSATAVGGDAEEKRVLAPPLPAPYGSGRGTSWA